MCRRLTFARGFRFRGIDGDISHRLRTGGHPVRRRLYEKFGLAVELVESATSPTRRHGYCVLVGETDTALTARRERLVETECRLDDG